MGGGKRNYSGGPGRYRLSLTDDPGGKSCGQQVPLIWWDEMAFYCGLPPKTHSSRTEIMRTLHKPRWRVVLLNTCPAPLSCQGVKSKEGLRHRHGPAEPGGLIWLSVSWVGTWNSKRTFEENRGNPHQVWALIVTTSSFTVTNTR